MARLLRHLVEAPRDCSYLPGTTATLEHRVMVDVTADELGASSSAAGAASAPTTSGPRAPLQRVPADAHRGRRLRPDEEPAPRAPQGGGPPRDRRPARRRRGAARALPPLARDREAARAWAPAALDAATYALQFAFPHPAAREVAFHDDEAGGRLVGMGICDEAPRAWSLVYFFYDPAYAARSLGVANVVVGVEIAAARGIPYVYLGYASLAALRSATRPGSPRARSSRVGRQMGEAPRWLRVG